MKDYYSLAEVAKLLDVQIDEIEEDIFKGKIIPSRNMKRPVDADLSIEEELPPDKDNYGFTETRFIKQNISFSGNVDIYGLTGCTSDRKIELIPDGLKSVLSDKPIPILFCNHESQRAQVRLREPYSFRAEELIIRHDEVVRCYPSVLAEMEGQETHAAYIKRRLNEGVDREAIAFQLYQREASDYYIGRVLSEERPGDEKSTISKRGLRFREKNGLPSKNKH